MKHIQQTVQSDPVAKWFFILDQLNTHKSASLVEWVAQVIGDKQDLGKKGKSGILKNMESRKAYLSNPTHQIRFVYTPKHCSWLNLIECWFSILSKRVLLRGNFTSKEDLEKKITAYVEYHNRRFAKKFNWRISKKKDIQKLVQKVKRMVLKVTP